ncbi:MAG: recombinase family protein [Bacteroidota bacterium]
MTTAAIYIRKSREDKDKPSQRLTVQREQLPAHATANGWAISIYDDGHASAAQGKTESLKERARLEADIRAGRINIILTIELSRLSRDDTMQDYIAWLTLCADYRVKLATMSRILDPAQHSDWMLLLMEGGFSSVEMKVLQGRMKEGRDEAYRTGKFLGGGSPPPYVLDKTQGRLVIDPELLEQMAQIWTMAETMSARAISIETGKPEIFIRRSLADDRLQFYQAIRPDQQTGEPITCDWEPVMTAATAKRIQAARRVRATDKGGTKREFGALLSNLQLVFCGYCGRTVKTWANTRTRKDGTCLNYYGCQTKDTRNKCDRARLVAQDVIDSAVITNLFNTLDALDELKQIWEDQHNKGNSGEDLSNHIADMKKAQEKKRRLISAITNGVMDLADAKEAMDEIKAKIETLERLRDEAVDSIRNPPDWGSIDLPREDFDALDKISQRIILRLAIERIDLYNMHMIITYKFPRRADGTTTAKINLPPMHRGKRLDK